MGDGQVKKYAIIINGDTQGNSEDDHLANVEKSLKILETQGYETYVVSTQKPRNPHDHYVEASCESLAGVTAEVRKKIDSDDDLVIYTTGHGLDEAYEGVPVFGDEFCRETMLQLDIKKYGHRTIIMDQCYGGNQASVFVDDPKTLIITAGKEGQSTSCQEFAPYFWKDSVEIDANTDGAVSWEERFKYAQPYVTKSTPTMTSSGSGMTSFTSEVIEITSAEEYADNMKSLKPGQYAVVTFSAEWCSACETWTPLFRQLAEESNGKYLFLKVTTGEKKPTEDGPTAPLYAEYHVTTLPTVYLVDSHGTKIKIPSEQLNTFIKNISIYTDVFTQVYRKSGAVKLEKE